MRLCVRCSTRGYDRPAERSLPLTGEASCATCYRFVFGPRDIVGREFETIVSQMGVTLSTLRYQTGVKSHELRDALGASPNQVADYLHGRRPPNLKRLLILCHLFGVRPDELLGYAGGRSKPEELTQALEEVQTLKAENRKLREDIDRMSAPYDRADFPHPAPYLPGNPSR